MTIIDIDVSKIFGIIAFISFSDKFIRLSLYLTLVAVARDDGGDEGGDPHRVGARVGVVPVQLDQVVDGQPDADYVHEDPEEVDDVVAEGTLD